jgi:hypothetical protein
MKRFVHVLAAANLSAHEGPNGDFDHVAAKGTDLLGVPIVSYSVAVD